MWPFAAASCIDVAPWTLLVARSARYACSSWRHAVNPIVEATWTGLMGGRRRVSEREKERMRE